ncbi:hypothetical protein QC762_0010800 [Podospora pseudocomata]|uniref:Uncharacterized protein n=1 Tax=Podospora pseudocomata TaxID=2093779 RepID=A0ABR0GV47_9PEZI|nr:hypothetical protein QC762_0010800 [Podospora pseudocomata]
MVKIPASSNGHSVYRQAHTVLPGARTRTRESNLFIWARLIRSVVNHLVRQRELPGSRRGQQTNQ